MIVNKIALMKDFAQQKNLTIITSAKVTSLTNGMVVYSKDGKEESRAGFDTKAVAVGCKARDGLLKAPEKHFGAIEIVGDCKAPRKALEAIEEGFFAGLSV